MNDVIDLAAKRPPTYYTVRIAHHWDGTLEFFVEDVPNDDRTRKAIAWAMEQGMRVFSTPADEAGKPE